MDDELIKALRSLNKRQLEELSKRLLADKEGSKEDSTYKEVMMRRELHHTCRLCGRTWITVHSYKWCGVGEPSPMPPGHHRHWVCSWCKTRPEYFPRAIELLEQAEAAELLGWCGKSVPDYATSTNAYEDALQLSFPFVDEGTPSESQC